MPDPATHPPVTLELWSHPRNSGLCKGCKRPIVWRRTVKHNRPICFDELPEVLRRFEDEVTHRVVEVVTADTVHWRTCPASEKFRRAVGTQTQGRLL